MRKAQLSPRARRDLLAATSWIARDNPIAAAALRDAVTRAAAQIGRHPNCGTERPNLAGPPRRFLPLTGFPYIIAYNAATKPPLIIRILHGARDLPTALRER